MKGTLEAAAFVLVVMAIFFCVGVALMAFVAGEVFSPTHGAFALVGLIVLPIGLALAPRMVARHRRNK